MASEKPRRRWFRPRYSLTTLLVLVTVVGVWLGWELDFIRRRQSALKWLRAGHGYAYDVPSYEALFNEPPSPQIPIWRQWLGDEDIVEIGFKPYYAENPETEDMASLFPEAWVHYKDKTHDPIRGWTFR